MSITRTSSLWRPVDHFEPDDSADPQAQRRLRGLLEQIDYTAYASNREVIAQTLGTTDAAKFQRMAVAVAESRARWVAAALAATEAGHAPKAEAIEQIGLLRHAYHELAEAYDAMRRMVERGYLPFTAA